MPELLPQIMLFFILVVVPLFWMTPPEVLVLLTKLLLLIVADPAYKYIPPPLALTLFPQKTQLLI